MVWHIMMKSVDVMQPSIAIFYHLGHYQPITPKLLSLLSEQKAGLTPKKSNEALSDNLNLYNEISSSIGLVSKVNLDVASMLKWFLSLLRFLLLLKDKIRNLEAFDGRSSAPDRA